MKKTLQAFLLTLFCVGQFAYAQCEISENFDSYENGAVPVGWTMINTTGVAQSQGQVSSNPASPTPPKYFRMFNSSGMTGELLFISPMNATTSDGNHRLKFYAQGHISASLIVGTTNKGDGTGALNTIATLPLTGTNNANWVAHEVIIPAGTDQYIFFQHNLGVASAQVNIDSVCLETIPTCLEVTNVALSNPTQTSVNLSWTESGTGENNWEYVVQKIGVGIPTTNGTAFSSTDANPSITVGNLAFDTDYEAYVRASCGGGDFGTWIKTSATIRTLCGTRTSNFCDDFAGIPANTVPFCWSTVDEPGGGTAVVNPVSLPGGGIKNMFVLTFTSTTTGNIIAISPEASFATDGSHRLRFKAGSNDAAAANLLRVGTIDGAGNFVQITAVTLSTDRNVEYVVQLPNNGHSKFAFKHSGAVNKTIWINTVCIEDTPSCLEVSAITATNIQYNSADISWTASGSGETAWEYLIQQSSLPAPDASTSGTETTTNTVNVPLAQNTAYKAYVRAKCGTSSFGAWVASQEFKSNCASYVAEYQDGFEGVNVSGEEVKPCWSVNDTTNGDLKTFGTSFNINPFDGQLMLRFYVPTNANPEGLALISPEFSDIASDKQIRFRMNKRGSNEANFKIIVGTVASPTDMSTFTVLDGTTLDQTTITADTWKEFIINFSNYNTSLGHHYIVFKAQHSGTGLSQYIFMDDFHYEFAASQGLNDEPTTAHVLPVSSDYTCNNAITGNFVGATRSPNYPCIAPAYNNHKDLWYRFTPSESGKYAFEVKNPAGGDVNMFIFKGSSVALQPLSSGCGTRSASLMLNAGETYFVSISSSDPNTQFSLCVSKFPAVPVNDEPSGAILLTESADDNCSNGLLGHTASATHSTESVCGASTEDVWYTFVPLQTANYTFRKTLINGSTPTSIAVFSGTPGNLTQVTTECTSYLQRVDLTAGQTYYVSVSSAGSSIPIYFTVCAYPSPPAPVNDECSGSLPLTVGSNFESSSIIGNSTSATRNVNDPMVTCDGLEFAEKGKDVWYKVTIPNSGNLKLETRTNGDLYLDDMGLQIYTGTCGNLVSLKCDSDSGEGFFNYINLNGFQPGTEIWVRTWGYAGRYGYFKIAAYDDSPSCASPINVTVSDINRTTAKLSWTAPTPAPTDGYRYTVQFPGEGYPAVDGGTATSQTSVSVQNLIAATDYEAYVKSACGAWVGPILFTTSSLGVSDHPADSFKFYPNPVTDILNVSHKEVIKEITVYSLTGQKVLNTKLNATSGQIKMNHLTSGVYMVEATVGHESIRFRILVN